RTSLPPPTSPLFPYTTLFRSKAHLHILFTYIFSNIQLFIIRRPSSSLFFFLSITFWVLFIEILVFFLRFVKNGRFFYRHNDRLFILATLFKTSFRFFSNLFLII